MHYHIYCEAKYMKKTIMVLLFGLTLFGCARDRYIPISEYPGAVNWKESAGGICGVYLSE